jgi:hypothetical protein
MQQFIIGVCNVLAREEEECLHSCLEPVRRRRRRRRNVYIVVLLSNTRVNLFLTTDMLFIFMDALC